MSKDIKKCAECRESEDCIWIKNPMTKTHEEEQLCEGCYDLLCAQSGMNKVHGSQWMGEL
jgi:hypothetical protein